MVFVAVISGLASIWLIVMILDAGRAMLKAVCK
jgi:hypothetical protein